MSDTNVGGAKITSAREAALESLTACRRHGKYPNLEVASTISKSKKFLSDADRRLYTQIVYGVTERMLTLDYIISTLSSRSVSDIDLQTLMCLRMGLYQLLYLDRVPPHAAVSETVSLAKKQSRGFVNAVLREFLRRDKKFALPSEKEFPTEHLSVKYSCPVEMCSFLISKIGKEKTERLLLSTFSKRSLSLRVNTLATSAKKLCESEFPTGKINALCDDIIDVPGIDFKKEVGDGWFVQDAASRLAVKALAPRPGECVVDTCAAPGGKSFSAAIDMKNSGRVISFDIHENKISLIKKGAERLGLGCIEASCRSAEEPDVSLIGKADRVICDAPCSGLGVISKKPDIKYKSVSDIERLPSVQKRILDGASRYVRDGGVLVYSTCTVNPDENEEVVRDFLKTHEDFSPRVFSFDKTDGERLSSSDDGMLTFFEHETSSDGFFIAKMVKRDK